jgi:phosphoglycerate dehydrogenase-like enzyme
MAPKIVVARHVLTDVEVAQKMLPGGFELAAVEPNTPEFRAAMAGAKFLVGYGGRSMDDAFYQGAPNLKLIQLLSAGYDTCDLEAATRARVPICNNGGANSIAVAEHTFALLLAVTRQITFLHKLVSTGAWRGNEWLGKGYYELAGKTLGIVGLGTIGKKVARIAKGFGMNVLYNDIIRLNEDAEDALGARFRLLREVLQASDIVSLHVPLTDATRHMINATTLKQMQPHAILINTCRGPVVDEPALHRALTGGTIQAAGLDVFDEEPTPSNNPLLGLENVVLTPHLAGLSADNRAKGFRNAFDNVQRVERGETPLWIIPPMREQFGVK